MLTHHLDMLLLLLSHGLMAAAYGGWGMWLGGALRLRGDGDIAYTGAIWLGWIVVIGLLHLAHFAVAVSAPVSWVVHGAGLVLCLRGCRRWRPSWWSWRRVLPLCVAVLPFVWWVLSKAMTAPSHYDSGQYHFGAIRWIEQFPLVPGLGNLHSRLAYNQALFPWTASLHHLPPSGSGHAIGMSFLMLLTAATLLEALRRQRPAAWLRVADWNALFAAQLVLSVFYLSHVLFFEAHASSPSPDNASFIVQIAVFSFFLQSRVEGAKREVGSAVTALLLTVALVMLKVSNAAFAGVLVVIVLAGFRGVRNRWRMLLRIGFVCVLLIVPWMLRGYVMTGMPLYPSTIGRIAFDWSVPAVQAETEAYCVRTMAQGYDLRWREAPRDWSWMSMWFDGLLYHRFTVIVPLLQGALLLVAAMVLLAPSMRRGVRRSGSSVFIPVLPVAAALVFWFFAAPHPRFANAQFVLFATAGVFACGDVLTSRRSRVFAARVLLAVTLLCVLPQAYYGINRRHKLKEISLTGVQPVPRAALRTIVTRSGLKVHVPVQGRLTWDAPLPAAPSVNPHLRLRVPGRLDRGFVGIRPEEWVDQI